MSLKRGPLVVCQLLPESVGDPNKIVTIFHCEFHKVVFFIMCRGVLVRAKKCQDLLVFDCKVFFSPPVCQWRPSSSMPIILCAYCLHGCVWKKQPKCVTIFKNTSCLYKYSFEARDYYSGGSSATLLTVVQGRVRGRTECDDSEEERTLLSCHTMTDVWEY